MVVTIDHSGVIVHHSGGMVQPFLSDHDHEAAPVADHQSSDHAQMVVAGIVVGVVVLMLADMIAGAGIIPVGARVLAVSAAVVAVQLYLHRVEMAAIRERQRGEEYIAGYVDGIERRPPRPGRY